MAKNPAELLFQVKGDAERVSRFLGTNVVSQALEFDLEELDEDELKEKYRARIETLLSIASALDEGGEEGIDVTKPAKLLAALNSLDEYISLNNNNEERVLRDSQFEVLQVFRDFLEAGNTEGYFKLPTGYGKTVLFIEMIKALGLKNVIVVAPTRTLVRQIAKEFKKFAPELEVGRVFSDAKEYGKDITITTYNSLTTGVDDGRFDPDNTDCLVLDEVHNSLSDSRVKVVNEFKDAIKAGFSATPKYSDEKQASKLLGQEIASMAMDEAILDGLLASVKVMLVKTAVDLSKVKLDRGKYNDKQFEKAVNIESVSLAAVEFYQKVADGKRAIAYCAGVQHAEDLTEIFNDSGVSARCVHSRMKPGEVEKVLKDHKAGKFKVLCNAQMLIEGYDDPGIYLGLNVGHTESLVNAEQRGGRPARLNPQDLAKIAVIAEFLHRDRRKSARHITIADVLKRAEFICGARSGKPPVQKAARNAMNKMNKIKFNIKGVEVVSEANEVMEVVNKMAEEAGDPEAKLFAKDFLSESMVARELGVSLGRARKVFWDFYHLYPDRFKIKKRKHTRLDYSWRDRGYTKTPTHIDIHYCPRSLLPAMQKYLARETAPKNWVTEYVLRKNNKLSQLQLKELNNLADAYGEKLYGDFEFPLRKRYYDPDIVTKVKFGEIPDDWPSLYEIAEETGMGVRMVLSAAKSASEERPEWIRSLAEDRGVYRKNVHKKLKPRIIEILASESNVKLREAAESLTSIADAAKILHMTTEELIDLIKKAGLEDSKGFYYEDEKGEQQYVFKKGAVKTLRKVAAEKCNWKLIDSRDAPFEYRYLRRILRRMEGEDGVYVVQWGAKIDGNIVRMSDRAYEAFLAEIDKDRPEEGWVAEERLSDHLKTEEYVTQYFLGRLRIEKEDKKKFLQRMEDKKEHMKPFHSPRVVASVDASLDGIKSAWSNAKNLTEELSDTEARITAIINAGFKKQHIGRELIRCTIDGVLYFREDVESFARENVAKCQGMVKVNDIKARMDCFEDDHLNMRLRMLRSIIDSDAFFQCFDEEGDPCDFVATEAEGLIKEHAEAVRTWKTSLVLAEEIGCRETDLNTFIYFDADQRGVYQEEMNAVALCGGGEWILHVPSALEERVKEYMIIPDGWRNYEELMEHLECDEEILAEKLSAIRDSHVDEIGMFWDNDNRCLAEYVSLEVADILHEQLESVEQEIYRSAEEMAVELEQTEECILDIIKSIGSARVNNGIKGFSIPDDEVELRYNQGIFDAVKERLPAPEGWMTYIELGEELDKVPTRIKAYADRLQKSADWQKKFFNPRRRASVTHMHPKLCELIDEELG